MIQGRSVSFGVVPVISSPGVMVKSRIWRNAPRSAVRGHVVCEFYATLCVALVCTQIFCAFFMWIPLQTGISGKETTEVTSKKHWLPQAKQVSAEEVKAEEYSAMRKLNMARTLQMMQLRSRVTRIAHQHLSGAKCLPGLASFTRAEQQIAGGGGWRPWRSG